MSPPDVVGSGTKTSPIKSSVKMPEAPPPMMTSQVTSRTGRRLSCDGDEDLDEQTKKRAMNLSHWNPVSAPLTFGKDILGLFKYFRNIKYFGNIGSF